MYSHLKLYTVKHTVHIWMEEEEENKVKTI